MIIALKEKDRVLVGVTARDCGACMSEQSFEIPENLPAWKVKGVKNCYVFADKSDHSADLLRYNDAVFKGITDVASIIKKVVPAMKKLLMENSCSDGKTWDNNLTIVKDGKIFHIYAYFDIAEVDGPMASSFRDFVQGFASDRRNLPADKLISDCFKALSEFISKRMFPVTVFDCSTGRKKVYYG